MTPATELETPPPPSLPSVPRPASPRARRRSWAEAPVRLWLILTLLVAAVTAIFLYTRIEEARRDRWLVLNGKDVVAKFTLVNGDPVKKRRPRNEVMAGNRIEFTYDAKKYALDVPRLEAKPGAYAVVGEDFKIKVDPADPTLWTEQTEPVPWSQELTAVGFLAPLLLLLVAVTLWRRSVVLRVWRDGGLTAGVVVNTKQSSVAPASRIVRYHLAEGADRRIFHVLLPMRFGIPQSGETIWLLSPPGKPNRAIAAKAYE